MRQVVVADLGVGNLRSVARALERAGASVEVSSEPERIAKAERLVVPGQGHFADAASAMAGPIGAATRALIASGRPYLGLCLGLQILFDESEEAPGRPGLGVFGGSVARLRDGLSIASPRGRSERRKVPHMGWNEVRSAHPMLPAAAWFYFVHAYHAVPSDPSVIVATAEYGEPLVAGVARDNVLALQFHPEKSARSGALVLEAFVRGGP